MENSNAHVRRVPFLDTRIPDPDPIETAEWLEAFDDVVLREGSERARFLLNTLLKRAQRDHLRLPELVQTPYVNTIPPEEEPPYPGDEAIERRIRRIIRWNAVAMVLRAGHVDPGIGGHLSTYASAATLYEVGFNHFFRGRTDEDGTGDQVFFQGHSSPGIYARAFLEGHITAEQMEHFRRESAASGLSSYPHPWLMPDFWEFPTVSMGLGPIAAIYQARFNRYLQHRGIKDTDASSRVWCFVGDGETDEPESLGSLSIAAREGLDNLIFVVNCNLQRLDGPVRGNGKIIQELEAVFRGAGWNVIKVLWGRDYDPLFAADTHGVLVKACNDNVDGDYQKLSTESGGYIRTNFFGTDPRLLSLVQHLTDAQLQRLRRGGHDAHKVFAAYHQATTQANGRPTAILAHTIKGWTLGEGAQGRNVAHQMKKFNQNQLKVFRDMLELPIPDAQLMDAPFYTPHPRSTEIQYLQERREMLGGFVPRRKVVKLHEEIPPITKFQDILNGSGTVDVSTTKAFAKLLADLLKEPGLGKRIVPIIPDEARTFGLDALFRQFGIYSSVGQLYEPVDKDLILSYREARDGQVLEEGITEAGSMATFMAAGTSYATHHVNMIPFYIFYSMFGFQRTGDQVWQFGDARGKGFLLGATAGRTTLNGEGLQHQDGHSHILASVVPNVETYDPAFAYEVAVIVQNGLVRMYQNDENVFYYISLYNEAYLMPPMPEGVMPGILKGLYRFKATPDMKSKARVQLVGSGTILREALRAQDILATKYDVAADVWSATSFTLLRREALAVERHNVLHPGEAAKVPYVVEQLGSTEGPVVAVSDWIRAFPDQIARWLGDRYFSLGTDGFGRSDTRAALRHHFEVSAEWITYTALQRLSLTKKFEASKLPAVLKELGLEAHKPNPVRA
jgi:pyruvate dehydrogenase E1 component